MVVLSIVNVATTIWLPRHGIDGGSKKLKVVWLADRMDHDTWRGRVKSSSSKNGELAQLYG